MPALFGNERAWWFGHLAAVSAAWESGSSGERLAPAGLMLLRLLRFEIATGLAGSNL